MPHGMTFCARAVLYAGWKLNRVPVQSDGLVFMNPFLAEAIMKPLLPVVRSVSRTLSARPPGIFASHMWTVILSPGFIIRVLELGVNVARLPFCGLGGPVGPPLVCTEAKLTGSVQFGLQLPLPLPWHSRLSMLSAEHQCASSQLVASSNGAKPGG